jgi:hypothetical protein
VRDGERLLSSREKGVEVSDAEGFGWRDFEPSTGVIERTGTDPADSALNGVEHWKEELTRIGQNVEGLEARIDGCTFVVRRFVVREVKVHQELSISRRSHKA